MKTIAKRLSLAAGAMALLVGLNASSASAAFGIKAFDGQVTADAGGSAFTQALGHPYEAATWIDFNTKGVSKDGEPLPDGNVKDLVVDAPPGLIGNPTVAAHCTEGQMESYTCPPESQVGFLTVRVLFPPFSTQGSPLYNMVPRDGNVAEFGSLVLGNALVHIAPIVRSDGDYGLRLESQATSQGLALSKIKVALWGVPSDPSHDPLRLDGKGSQACFEIGVMICFQGNTPSSLPDKPFLANPGDCSAGPFTTTVTANSWQEPGNYSQRSFTSHLPPSYPLEPGEWGAPTGVTGCENTKFQPAFEAEPTSTLAGEPTGLDVKLAFGQDGLEDKEGTAASPLRDARVTLPEGMAINPAAASGLQACADSQLGLDNKNPVACPDSAKIGSATANSPLLQKYDENGSLVTGPGGVPILDELRGSVYIRSQASSDPESGEMFRLALVLENEVRGLRVKLPGQVRVNPNTGQLVTSFQDNPQLPVGEIELSLNSGPRAALVAPQVCGPQQITAELSSWSGHSQTISDSFKVTGCGNGGFAPKLSAGSANPIAGAHSPFNLRLTREGGEAAFTGIAVDAPKGLTAALKGIPYCPEANLGGAGRTTGSAQLANPSCPAASQIGTVTVGAGAGPLPFYLSTGKAYLAGPYKGGPLSMAILTPAVAGPFDLGTVLTRAAIKVDPTTAEITVDSDPIPTMLAGVPLDIRDLRVSVDRPQFTLNPTSCAPKTVAVDASGTGNAKASLSKRYQVADCASLPFKPSLKLKVSGGTKRGSYTKLRAELKAPPGQANIGKASVALPHSIFLAQEHIRTICTRVQYAAKACPAASVYGYARAFTPLLDRPLEGPVYLRSSNNELPDLVASLDGQIHIDLVGRIDSVNGGIRNTFEGVPDAPVSKFVLTMKGGKKSLLVNSANLCAKVNRATVKLDGQNGMVHDFRPAVRNDCGKKSKKRGGGKKRK